MPRALRGGAMATAVKTPAHRERNPLAGAFRQPDASQLVSRSLQRSTLTVTELRGNANHGMTGSMPFEDAYLIALQLVACPDHDLFIDGRHKKPKNWVAGVTSIFDLRRDPIADLRDPFHSLMLHLPRRALHDIGREAGASVYDELRYQPDLAIFDPVAGHLLASLLPALARPDEASALFVDHVVSSLTAHIAHAYGGLRAVNRPARGGLAPWQQRRAEELLSANLDGAIPLERLAAECGLSARHFARAFKASTGVPPHRWLLRQRVERAKDRLRDPRQALLDVALSCGFADQSHFTRVFTSTVGLSPGAWRRAIKAV
jgi:AraC family transcriptional regulator